MPTAAANRACAIAAFLPPSFPTKRPKSAATPCIRALKYIKTKFKLAAFVIAPCRAKSGDPAKFRTSATISPMRSRCCSGVILASFSIRIPRLKPTTLEVSSMLFANVPISANSPLSVGSNFRSPGLLRSNPDSSICVSNKLGVISRCIVDRAAPLFKKSLYKALGFPKLPVMDEYIPYT